MENTAKLEFAIDLANQKQLSAFATLFATLSGQEIERPAAVTEVTVSAPKTVSKAASKAALKAEPAKTETAEQEATKTEPEPETVKAEPEVKITAEAIRDEVSKKIGDHRDKIKAKLTSFGTNNITALAKEHYVEFMDFVKAL